LQDEYTKLSKDIDAAKERKDSVSKKINEKFKKDSFDIDATINDAKGSIKEYNTKLSALTSQLNETKKMFDEVRSAKDTFDRLSNQLVELNDTLDSLNADVIQTESQINNVNQHLDVVQHMITLAKREFRGVLLQNIISFINKKVKGYSQEVFGTTALSFSLNENCIDITYCNKPYENLSGGEKQKIDIIVQLALRDILSKQLNIHTNMLVCDEVLDNIDSVGAEKIINIIQS